MQEIRKSFTTPGVNGTTCTGERKILHGWSWQDWGVKVPRHSLSPHGEAQPQCSICQTCSSFILVEEPLNSVCLAVTTASMRNALVGKSIHWFGAPGNLDWVPANYEEFSGKAHVWLLGKQGCRGLRNSLVQSGLRRKASVLLVHWLYGSCPWGCTLSWRK